ncbi:hypothetical protein H311_02188 [Anncaliia algerae PRA109]|nr:hypothetical protein H311_02188 [Anncaliia algerae PRA109]
MDIQRQEKFREKDCFVKIDITNLKYRYKSHRVRTVLNKIFAVCILEINILFLKHLL